MTPLILASSSNVRRQLLANAGISVEVIAAPIDERLLEVPMIAAGASPADIAAMLAEAKAVAVSALAPAALVIGADQTLDLDGERFTKPVDIEDARRHLMTLSGKTHFLQSAVTVACSGEVVWQHIEAPRLAMRTLTESEVDRYLAEVGGAALSSVGCYQIEGPGIRLFERIEGDYFSVLGLPLLPLISFLRRQGAVE